MNITLDIDDELLQKVSKIASAQNTTVAAMVAEYLTGIANDQAAERRAHAARLMETFEKLSRDIGPRTWTRDDLYEERFDGYGR